MAKKDYEEKRIMAYCAHQTMALRALGYDHASFKYDNIREEITVDLSLDKRVVVNVGGSSTRAVLQDVAHRLGPHLKGAI